MAPNSLGLMLSDLKARQAKVTGKSHAIADFDRGLRFVPVVRLKQRKQLTKKKRQRFTDIPPYIVPLSLPAQEIVRHLLGNLKPAQVYLIPSDGRLKNHISEKTFSGALERMGYGRPARGARHSRHHLDCTQ